PMLVGITLFICITIIIISLSNNRLKRKMIELGHVDENSIKLLNSTQSWKFKFNALKWGLILFFAGMGLVVIALLPHYLQFNSPLPFGLELMFIALGFLIYFFLVKNNKELPAD